MNYSLFLLTLRRLLEALNRLSSVQEFVEVFISFISCIPVLVVVYFHLLRVSESLLSYTEHPSGFSVFIYTSLRIFMQGW